MLSIAYLLLAAIYAGAAWVAAHEPQTLSGYSLLSPGRREAIDGRALGRWCARLLCVCALVSLGGAFTPLFSWREQAAPWIVGLPVPLLIAGMAWGWMRYDMYFAVRRVRRDKERYLPLLLEGDESEAMIRRYLDRAELYLLRLRGETVALCAVTDEGRGIYEVKNLVVAAPRRRQGHGRRMLAAITRRYRHRGKRRGQWLLLGTGETPSTLAFYRSCGFETCGRRENFFTDNYPRPIVEEGVLLRDMILLRKKL